MSKFDSDIGVIRSKEQAVCLLPFDVARVISDFNLSTPHIITAK